MGQHRNVNLPSLTAISVRICPGGNQGKAGTGEKTGSMKTGDRVVYAVPGRARKYGVATSEVNAYNRIGVQFDDGGWAYCWADYVRLHPFAPQTRRI
jgi:hypothetical protein